MFDFLRKHKVIYPKLRYVPQPDITTWELAQVVSLVIAPWSHVHPYLLYKELSPECQRHFEVKEVLP